MSPATEKPHVSTLALGNSGQHRHSAKDIIHAEKSQDIDPVISRNDRGSAITLDRQQQRPISVDTRAWTWPMNDKAPIKVALLERDGPTNVNHFGKDSSIEKWLTGSEEIFESPQPRQHQAAAAPNVNPRNTNRLRSHAVAQNAFSAHVAGAGDQFIKRLAFSSFRSVVKPMD